MSANTSLETSETWSRYAKFYDPIKIGSIDGTDTEPHDRAIARAINSEYKPNRHVKGRPECTIFISRLSPRTTKDTIRDTFSKYGRLRRFRLVKDIVTGIPKGYAFVEYESERSAEEAYRKANKLNIDGQLIFVDFECERLLKGWKPRRFGGGFGGRKESGQLRIQKKTDAIVTNDNPVENLEKVLVDHLIEIPFIIKTQDEITDQRQKRNRYLIHKTPCLSQEANHKTVRQACSPPDGSRAFPLVAPTTCRAKKGKEDATGQDAPQPIVLVTAESAPAQRRRPAPCRPPGTSAAVKSSPPVGHLHDDPQLAAVGHQLKTLRQSGGIFKLILKQ